MNPGHAAFLLAVVVWPASVTADETELVEPVRPYVRRVVESLDSLPTERQQVLSGAADYVIERIESGQPAQLVFICTHNSRRSHLSHIWCQTAIAYYDVPGVKTYSGGTQETACNIRTIRALRRAGLSAVTSTEGKNPVYLVQYAEDGPPIRAYSKLYTEEGNPTSEFAALICCSDADRSCPVVDGADGRFALHYEDPKVADDTPLESQQYDERSLEIAREMFFLMSEVARRLDE